MKLIQEYRSWFFDCDGVILDSNRIKSKAIYEVACLFSPDRAQEFLEYHKQNGGKSRFKKFRHLFETMLNQSQQEAEANYQIALKEYNRQVVEQLVACEYTDGFLRFFEQLPAEVPKYVVSGGMQLELREVLQRRGIAERFDGVYGSPASKPQILQRLAESPGIPQPSMFVGDSRFDLQSARGAGLDFVFLTQYTDLDNWRDFLQENPADGVFLNFTEWIQSEN